MQRSTRPIALITGANRGLGETLAGFLAASGYDLLLNARGEQALNAVANRLDHFGGRVRAIGGDVGDAAVRAALIAAAGAMGGLDLLINNASELGVSPLPPLADYPLNDLMRIYDINVFAPLGLIQAALPLLRESHGLVVNISSDAAAGGYAGWGGYGSSKAALDLISKTLANEISADGVGVVSVDPGDMRTAMHQQAFPGEDISDRPLPDVTLPFWAWLFGQSVLAVSGRRYAAQASAWEAAREAL
ncbi:MAG: SDR family oxidoreductase [Anaerolineae bacterium]|nr:SDR family oxidoreductase [Anaerolineae bacterium]